MLAVGVGRSRLDIFLSSLIFVAPALGMTRYRDLVFRPFAQPSTCETSLASTLLFRSVSPNPLRHFLET